MASMENKSIEKPEPFDWYRGVDIFESKELVIGSDYHFDGNGLLVETPDDAEYIYYYHWWDNYGYLADSVEECKGTIDSMLNVAKMFYDEDNGETEESAIEYMVDRLNDGDEDCDC